MYLQCDSFVPNFYVAAIAELLDNALDEVVKKYLVKVEKALWKITLYDFGC